MNLKFRVEKFLIEKSRLVNIPTAITVESQYIEVSGTAGCSLKYPRFDTSVYHDITFVQVQQLMHVSSVH